MAALWWFCSEQGESREPENTRFTSFPLIDGASMALTHIWITSGFPSQNQVLTAHAVLSHLLLSTTMSPPTDLKEVIDSEIK